MQSTSKIIFMILCMLFTINTFSQRVLNGRLVFDSKASFDQAYEQLNKLSDNEQDPGKEVVEGAFYDPYPSLGAYERSLPGFSSLRMANLNYEFAQLQKGVHPDKLEEYSWLSAPVPATLLNAQSVIQIKDTIYYLKNQNYVVKILKANERVLSGILKGEPLTNFSKDIILEAAAGVLSDCTATFYPSTSYASSNTGSFIYSGTASPQATFMWFFGDGTSSTEKNPVKTFASPGTYFVSLTVTDGICSAFYTLPIPVNKLCRADFNYEKGGTPGLICFTNNSQVIGGNISSLKWDFGDGTTSTEPNPCHVFPCDKKWDVSLTIITSTGCTDANVNKVGVSSYKCCDNDIDEKETKFSMEVEKGKRLIKGNCEDVQFLWWRNVNAELRHYKKFGLWVWDKADLKVELIGNIYLPNELGCYCLAPTDISCYDEGHTWKVKAKSNHIGDKFKTSKEDPWRANFYEGGILRKTVVAPVKCD